MKSLFRKPPRVYKTITIIPLFIIFVYFLLVVSRLKSEMHTHGVLVGPKDMFYPMAMKYERKDWHDYNFIEYENAREGPGEQGERFELSDLQEIELNQKLFEIEGLFPIVSDKISVNRSVPDTRVSQ